MFDWQALYRPVVGQALEGLVWMPISSDSAELAATINCTQLCFSGAAWLRFDRGGSLMLSWYDDGERCHLVAGAERWRPHALDRLQAHWWTLIGAELIGAELFSHADDNAARVVAVRHVTAGGTFWIGSGGPNFVGDGDDLWVGLNCDPPNRPDLQSLGVIA